LARRRRSAWGEFALFLGFQLKFHPSVWGWGIPGWWMQSLLNSLQINTVPLALWEEGQWPLLSLFLPFSLLNKRGQRLHFRGRRYRPALQISGGRGTSV
jgi:hypothetical protein